MRWTQEEIKYLKDNYSNTSNEILSGKLNRSICAVVSKANSYLNLKKVKYCRLCGKDITEINMNVVVCKNCSKEYYRNYKRDWSLKNKDRLVAQWKKSREKNKERKKEADRLWRKNNKAKKRLTDKSYYNKVKSMKRVFLDLPSCVDCGSILENFRFKRCSECARIHKNKKCMETKNKNKKYYNEMSRKYRKRRKDLENKRRLELGLPLIGNNFKKEEELLFYVKKIFPNEDIIFHDRSFLRNGMELDIFIPNLNLAFEYQGRQHFEFKSTWFWKNYDEFHAQRLRDWLKRDICSWEGITLIEVSYREKLSEELVLSKLNRKGIDNVQQVLPNFSKATGNEIKCESKGE